MHLFLFAFALAARLAATFPRVYVSERIDGFRDARLTLRADGTYHYTNNTGSCWVDWDDQGHWRLRGNVLTLTSSELMSYAKGIGPKVQPGCREEELQMAGPNVSSRSETL